MNDHDLTEKRLLFERGGEFDESTFVRVLEEATQALEGSNIPYVLMGGIASSAMGRPRFTHDIDMFIRPTDGSAALDALDRCGFETQQTYPDWLHTKRLAHRLKETLRSLETDLKIAHGHAHNGKEKGLTPGGVTVRNVSQPVIKHAFNLYNLEPTGTVSIDHGPGARSGSA